MMGHAVCYDLWQLDDASEYTEASGPVGLAHYMRQAVDIRCMHECFELVQCGSQVGTHVMFSKRDRILCPSFTNTKSEYRLWRTNVSSTCTEARLNLDPRANGTDETCVARNSLLLHLADQNK